MTISGIESITGCCLVGHGTTFTRGSLNEMTIQMGLLQENFKVEVFDDLNHLHFL